MRRVGLRALLVSVGLCGVVLLLDLLPGLRSVLWIYWAPGMAVVAYLWDAIRGSFDAEMHPISSALAVLADVLFWWLVIYALFRVWPVLSKRGQR
jgi:hypothetical protein